VAVAAHFRGLCKRLLSGRRATSLVTAQDSEWDEADPDDEGRTTPTPNRSGPKHVDLD
jgi:hypothetical protein